MRYFLSLINPLIVACTVSTVLRRTETDAIFVPAKIHVRYRQKIFVITYFFRFILAVYNIYQMASNHDTGFRYLVESASPIMQSLTDKTAGYEIGIQRITWST